MGQEKEDWKTRAETLFFREHRKINDICLAVGRTRKYVSSYLRGCAGYAEEKRYRERRQEEKRRRYRREWDRTNRGCRTADGPVTAETMRREHDVAARILSSERY